MKDTNQNCGCQSRCKNCQHWEPAKLNDWSIGGQCWELGKTTLPEDGADCGSFMPMPPSPFLSDFDQAISEDMEHEAIAGTEIVAAIVIGAALAILTFGASLWYFGKLHL